MTKWAFDRKLDSKQLRVFSGLALIFLLSFSTISLASAQSINEKLILSESMNIINNEDQIFDQISNDEQRSKLTTNYKLSLAENLNVKTNDDQKDPKTKHQQTLVKSKIISMTEKLAIINSDKNNNAIILTVKSSSERKAIIERILNKNPIQQEKTIYNTFLDNQPVQTKEEQTIEDENKKNYFQAFKESKQNN